MSRRDALLRLHKSLMTRRSELQKRLGGDLQDLGTFNGANNTGDAADAAFDTGSEEVVSQLAELESRELTQIERALARLKQGTYGLCEYCGTRILVARLNALPFSTTCVKCQRDMETSPDFHERQSSGNWDKVSDGDAPEDHEVDLSEIEIDLTNNR